MGLYMYSASRLSIKQRLVVAALVILTYPAAAQLPDGPGKAETEKLCKQCHEIERSVSLRQDRAGWQSTIDKMVSLGADGTEKEFAAVLDYLSTNFAGEEMPKLNVNTARPIEFESRLSLKRSEAAAIVAYRTKNGPFKSVDDLKKVPGIDTAKIEAKKDRLAF
jgi:competence protein ComEA